MVMPCHYHCHSLVLLLMVSLSSAVLARSTCQENSVLIVDQHRSPTSLLTGLGLAELQQTRRLALSQGNYARAIQVGLAIQYSQQPAQLDTLLQLAQAYQLSGDLTHAQQQLETAQTDYADNPTALARLANQLSDLLLSKQYTDAAQQQLTNAFQYAQQNQDHPLLAKIGLNRLFEHNTVLINAQFSLDNMRNALKKQAYPIIHIASHGQFEADPNRTFLLTYDGKITMDKLSEVLRLTQTGQQVVELLTLSACQTALGNERAALGLAGVALRAGVRSALATLWFVNDAATSQLTIAFYQYLQSHPKASKAQALQHAQLQLNQQRLFRHPNYWAPFLLIGNWL